MQLLIVGASGYIGESLLKSAKSVCNACGTSSNNETKLLSLHLEQSDDFNYGLIQPADVVLLLAAISSPDICAREHERAWAVNVTGTSKFIAEALARGARVVFFSSDTVYGERKDKFDERTVCKPVGEYAVMKNEVERRFSENPSFKSIRLSYVFSHEDKFTRYLAGCAQRNEEAEVFHPFSRAVVQREDVVDGALALAQRWEEFHQRVLNFGGPEVLSRIEFAECLQRTVLPNLRFRVTEPDEAFFENRPRIIAMSSPLLSKVLGRPARTLGEAARIEFSKHSIR